MNKRQISKTLVSHKIAIQSSNPRLKFSPGIQQRLDQLVQFQAGGRLAGEEFFGPLHEPADPFAEQDAEGLQQTQI
ncbi:hypothetical protein [Nitrospirillum bahiense]|uniref:hypothetical protein n=1 Tax=Nitrospirillum amazonense TaxID=28077 RepID=UPI0011A90323|nr:hypothetical protein [Nitrospirillum amazonense]